MNPITRPVIELFFFSKSPSSGNHTFQPLLKQSLTPVLVPGNENTPWELDETRKLRCRNNGHALSI